MPRKKILRVSPNVKADCDVSKFFMTLSLLFLSFCSTYSFNLDQNLAINKNHWIQQKMKKTRDKETELDLSWDLVVIADDVEDFTSQELVEHLTCHMKMESDIQT